MRQFFKILPSAVLGLVLLGFAAAPVAAADDTTIAFGYSFQHLSGGGEGVNLPLGFGVDFAKKLPNKPLNIVVDIDMSKKSDTEEDVKVSTTLTAFAAGLRWKKPTTMANQPFAHVLLGIAHSKSKGEFAGQDLGSFSNSDGMLQLGAGILHKLNEKSGVVGQFDFRRIFSEGDAGNAIRIFVAYQISIM